MRIVITRRARLDVPDGINIFIFALAGQFLRSGYQVALVASEVGRLDEIRRHFPLPAYPRMISVVGDGSGNGYQGLSWKWLVAGRSILNRLQPDLIVHNGALPFRSRSMSCAVIHDMEPRAKGSQVLARLAQLYKWYSYQKADAIIATTHEILAACAAELRLNTEDVHLIYPCVDMHAYSQRDLAKRDDMVLHAGTADYKDPLASVEAFSRLERTSSRLCITGPVGDGLTSAVSRLPPHIRARIELRGQVAAEELRCLLGAARVALFPTHYAVPACSGTVLEAVASATPIVGSTNISEDVLQDGVNGFRRDSVAARADAMRRLLDDDALWTRMSDGARAIGRDFTAESVAPQYLSLRAGRRDPVRPAVPGRGWIGERGESRT